MSLSKEYVYFIRDRMSRAIKIGRTNNLKRRLSLLQGGNPRKLEPLIALETMYSTELERDIHNFLKDYKVRNEWYSMSAVHDFLKSIEIEIEEVPDSPFEIYGHWNTEFDIWIWEEAEKHYFEKWRQYI